MEAAEWYRKRQEIKPKVGAVAVVLAVTKVFVGGEDLLGEKLPYNLLLIELKKNGERMLVRALESYTDPKNGDEITLVWRRRGVVQKSKPLIYCLKAQNVNC